jgi:cytidylate kinase
MIIAIDGPAASGKGTIGRKLAEHYRYHFLDTGLLYRAVARAAIAAGILKIDEGKIAELASGISPAEVMSQAQELTNYGSAAAEVAALPRVRTALFEIQRNFASRPPGTVLDGRDIGTVVCPDADVKIFLVASPEVRARRRFRELVARGEATDEAAVLDDIKKRDEKDQNRAAAPLRAALDAHLLDTTPLDIDGAVRAAIDIVEAVRAGRQRV